MVNLGILPVGRVVAGRTIVTELTLVFVVLQMTAGARLRGCLELIEIARALVAGVTGQRRMATFQRKSHAVVIERLLAVGIQPIMTGKAVRAKGPGVQLHTRRVRSAVTGIAGRRVEAGNLLAVAVLTSEGLPGCCRGVPLQRIAYGIVWKITIVEYSQRRGRSSMIFVAALAWRDRLLGAQSAVQCLGIAQFLCDGGMANLAAIPHRDLTPGSAVARAAIVGQIRVGQHPAQRFGSLLRIEATRAEQDAALGQRDAADQQDRQRRSDDASA